MNASNEKIQHGYQGKWNSGRLLNQKIVLGPGVYEVFERFLYKIPAEHVQLFTCIQDLSKVSRIWSWFGVNEYITVEWGRRIWRSPYSILRRVGVKLSFIFSSEVRAVRLVEIICFFPSRLHSFATRLLLSGISESFILPTRWALGSVYFRWVQF